MKAWTQFCEHLSKTLGEKATQQWLGAFKIVRFDARNLYLSPRDDFAKMWFEEHVRPHLKTHLLTPSGKPINVHLSSAKKKPSIKQETEKSQVDYLPDTAPPHMTFENYSGECIAKSLLSNFKQGEYNPIYIYGPPGSGKTHLLAAFAASYPGSFFAHAETFTQHVVSAMRTSDMDRFRHTYRSIDALIIDDVHLLKKRIATQEEIFHTFNALHTAAIPIIISSSSPPSALEGIEERLISRFEWGITLPLDASANLEQILSSRLSDLSITPDAQDYLLTHFTCVPSLSKAIEALLLRSHMRNITASLTPLKCAELLQDILLDEKKTIAPQTILKAVADHFGITTSDLLSRSQERSYSHPRKVAMALFRDILKLPYAKIGEHFNRDHSTVMSSIRSIASTPDLFSIKKSLAISN